MNLSIIQNTREASIRFFLACSFSIIFAVLAGASSTLAQGFSFTYQGNLNDNGAAANGTYEVQFSLYDAASNGNQIGQTITASAITVTNGIFTVSLNFGSTAFSGPPRYLDIAVRPSGSPNPYTVLGPRQPITSNPYAVRSLTSATADNTAKLGGIDATQYVQTVDPRLSDFRAPLPGSPSYVQNSTSLQTAANFNIQGSGTASGTLSANNINAGTQYNLGGSRLLSTPGQYGNTVVGAQSGLGMANSDSNSFFGNSSGKLTTSGSKNSFFGSNAGLGNVLGWNNSFFGESSGYNNDNGHDNTFFGNRAGINNTIGVQNTFFGSFSGEHTVNGSDHTFVGMHAGTTNTNGFGNTLIGYQADVGFANLVNATAIGSNAQVTENNSLVLGSISGINSAFSNTNVGIGVTAPKSRLHLADNNGNILLGNGGCVSGFAGIGFASTLTCANYSLLGDGTDTIINRPTGGDIIFRENNGTQMTIASGGKVSINTLGTAGFTQLCRNASNQISTCSSSLRYKKNISGFTPGLNLVKQLRPITFDWKEGGMHDLGLGAEDVAKVNDLLVIHNEKGEVEGVKYDRIGVVLINAVKEQQDQIERQNNLIETLESRLAAVEKAKQKSPVRTRRYRNASH